MSREPCLLPVVVHFAQSFVAVTENWIYHQVVGTQRYRPVVATEQRENADQFPFDAIVYPETSGVRRQTPERLGLSSLASGVWRLVAAKHRLAVPLQIVSRAYERPLRAVRPALLHAHFGTQAVHLLRLRQRLRAPLVTTFYGYDAGSIPRLRGWRGWYRWLFQRGDRFLVEGSAFRQRLIGLGCPAEKVSVQHLGVDVEAIPFRPRRLEAGEPVRLLMAASFREKKGHEYAIRALALARERLGNLPVELRLIGDGELRPLIERLVRELRLESSVAFLGAQPHDRFLEEALRCHLYLAPSVTAADGDTEGGAPVAITEACATGMPVIGSLHADIPEVVRHGETGWLAPERDVSTLCDHLVGMLTRPDCWSEMGARARSHIELEYNLRTQAKRLDDVYDEVVSRQSLVVSQSGTND